MKRLFSVIACVVATGARPVQAQGTYISGGAVSPVGSFATAAAPGYDIAFLAQTGPVIGRTGLRIDIAIDHMDGKGAVSGYYYTSYALSFTRNFLGQFYGLGGVGVYNAQDHLAATIDGHGAISYHSALAAQAGIGMYIPIFRWQAFIELDGVRMFAPGPTIAWMPGRLGIRI
jgi:hypothetical protein